MAFLIPFTHSHTADAHCSWDPQVCDTFGNKLGSISSYIFSSNSCSFFACYVFLLWWVAVKCSYGRKLLPLVSVYAKQVWLSLSFCCSFSFFLFRLLSFWQRAVGAIAVAKREKGGKTEATITEYYVVKAEGCRGLMAGWWCLTSGAMPKLKEGVVADGDLQSLLEWVPNWKFNIWCF